MALKSCSACGKEIADTGTTCPHCNQPLDSVRRRGLPTWGKLLVFLILPMMALGVLVLSKPAEADLRQAIREKAKELEVKGPHGPALLIDDPKHAERFTYHDHILYSEIKYTTEGGKVITVASGQLGGIEVRGGWDGR